MAEERMLNDEILLGLIKANSGGGGGGTTDYEDLNNKPQIGGVTLSGNKSLSDLGAQEKLTAGMYININSGTISVKRDVSEDVDEVLTLTHDTSGGTNKINAVLTVGGETIDSETITTSGGTFHDLVQISFNGQAVRFKFKYLVASKTQSAGYENYIYNEYTDTFVETIGEESKLIIKSELDNALSGKQDTLTFDDVPTDNSNNPVKSNGIYDALELKQDATDNSLETTDKTIVGAINEHESDISSLKSGLTNVSSDIEELQAYTGYSSTDIIGIEVDYANKSFRRLGAAVGKNGGSDFDSFSMFGGRRRCNVADDGTISKYYGDTGYAEDGSNGQVMVYQPKFYYKMVPLKLEKQSTGKGYHIRKAAYYVTATPLKGFKVHPAFVNASGNEVDYILVGASKGCIYDVSESAYILDDAQVMDNTADKFSSIFGVKPASGLTQDLTRPKIEQMCQNRGANWHELNVQMASMTQLLMLIEYGKFDMQRAIGKGVVDIADNSSYNCGATSGSTAALGNASGRATSTTIVTNTSTTYTDDGKTSVTYRGEEDPYGDMWEFVMGMNIYGNGSMNGGEPYICSDYDYAESKNTGNYKGAGFTVANSDGYVNAWGYGSEDFDWLFIASEVGGSDALPVGDYLWKTANLNGYRIALMGARWSDAWRAGGFGWTLHGAVGYRGRYIAGRLAYIPA